MAKRRAKIVGDGIGKSFQFIVARFEVPSPPGEFFVEFENFAGVFAQRCFRLVLPHSQERGQTYRCEGDSRVDESHERRPAGRAQIMGQNCQPRTPSRNADNAVRGAEAGGHQNDQSVKSGKCDIR
jgi:hypothetical protein